MKRPMLIRSKTQVRALDKRETNSGPSRVLVLEKRSEELKLSSGQPDKSSLR